MFAYLIGIRVDSSNTDEHVSHLAQSFERLNYFGTIFKLEMYVHGASQVECIGCMGNAQGTSQATEKFLSIVAL